MPRHQNTFPASLVVTTIVPDTVQVPGVTVDAQLSFAAPGAPATGQPKKMAAWLKWLLIGLGVVMVLAVAAFFIFFGGGSTPHASEGLPNLQQQPAIQQQQQSGPSQVQPAADTSATIAL